MTKNCIKKSIFLGTVLALILSASSVFALEIHYPEIFGFSLNNTSTISDYVCYFYGLGINLAILAAIIAIAFGGAYYLISYSRGKFTNEAKDWIKSGSLGLLIVVCASVIISTINPGLNSCNLGVLSLINFIPSSVSSLLSNQKIVRYQEIPIGTLTEKLLTNTMGCYEFDQIGDPVDLALIDANASPVTDDGGTEYKNDEYYIPTYLNHDRADCLTKLVDGAQKKSMVIASLATKLKVLMDSCQCDSDKCNSHCDPSSTCVATGASFIGDKNKGGGSFTMGDECTPCWGPYCGFAVGGWDCIPLIPPCDGSCDPGSPSDCCPNGVKNQIEHGGDTTITVDVGCGTAATAPATGSTCKTNEIENSGLDEFRCPRPTIEDVDDELNDNQSQNENMCSGGGSGGVFKYDQKIKNTYATANLKNNKNQFLLAQVGGGGSGGTEDLCQSGDGDGNLCDMCSGTDIIDFIEEKVVINGKTIGLIRQEKWEELNLWQQLKYFQTKIANWPKDSKIQDDVNNLLNAEDTLGKCYLATPYIDLLKNYKGTNQEDTTIIKRKFNVVGSSEEINPSRYCQGFNYSNSSCLKKCNDVCPDTSSEAMTAYEGCEKDNFDCIKNAFNKRPCPYAGGDNPPATFEECISSCVGTKSDEGNTCYNNCSSEYSKCSYGYEFCINQCDDNSQCVLDNSDTCLLDANAFVDCAKQAENSQQDQGNIDYCVGRSYLCKNGSNEFSGYPDCAPTETIISPGSQTSCSDWYYKEGCELINGCKWDSTNCSSPKCDWEEGAASSPAVCSGLEEPACGSTAGCGWFTGVCNGPTICSNAPQQSICQNMSAQGCTWQAWDPELTGICTGPAICSTLSQKSTCQGMSGDGCVWKPKQCFLVCSTLPETTCLSSPQCVWRGSKCDALDCNCSTGACSTPLTEIECNSRPGQCFWDENVACTEECSGPPTAPPAGTIAGCYDFKNREDCENVKNCFWDGLGSPKCKQNFTASFYYGSIKPHWNSLKCPEPYNSPKNGTACYSKIDATASCQELCPETSKCPSASNCSKCPCDQITKSGDPSQPLDLNFYILDGSIGEYKTDTRKVLTYEMVGPECNEYSYNDDPLTFYCQDDPKWYDDPNKEGNNPTPIGTERIVDIGSGGEMPIGQTIDESEAWAVSLIQSSGSMSAYIGSALKIMSSGDAFQLNDFTLGNAYAAFPIQNYCKCDAKYEYSSPICTTSCWYWYTPRISYWPPMCGTVFLPCDGGPCAQMVSYTQQLWYYIKNFKDNFVNFYVSMVKEPRSDILKKLTYSRQTMNDCSLVGSAYGPSTRLLSCTRVEDELVSPINTRQMNFGYETHDGYKEWSLDGYCYGKGLNDLFDDQDLVNGGFSDNWFCAQEWNPSAPSQGNN